MRGSRIRDLGIPDGPLLRKAQRLCGRMAEQGYTKTDMSELLEGVAENPEAKIEHSIVGGLAEDLMEWKEVGPRDEPVDYGVWGDELDPQAIKQMERACRLPISIRGALMPDCHKGYGLPVGGVLATKNAVIPKAVGVDIACRMRMSVFDLPPSAIDRRSDELSKILETETSFGMGAGFERGNRRSHEVMDRDWREAGPVAARQKDKGWKQLGSSGGGNHFAEFRVVKMQGREPKLGLMTHSGSRGPGATIANHYSKVAEKLRPELPDDMRHLAWLELGTEEGDEYWAAMKLMADFAQACHESIHTEVRQTLGESVEVLEVVENYHNLAWRETHDGEEMIVHRKGATPASEGEMGIIPATMADAARIVVGRGSDASMNSASHGAGRRMSRSEARREVTDQEMSDVLKKNGVRLLSAGLDETPHAYKDIERVM